MEFIEKCPYCLSEKRETIGVQKGEDKYLSLIDKGLNEIERKWFKCNKCDFIYRSPRITQDEATILYAKYRSFDFRKIMPDDYFDKITKIPLENSESYRKALFLKNNIDDEISSILDVGCGGGIFLFHLKNLYPEAKLVGLEPNQEYASMVRRKLGIDIIEDFYKEDIIDETFDLTVSTDVIEHIHDLDVFWKAAQKNIKKDKYLFIEVPSKDDFNALDIEHDVFESPHLYFFSYEHIVQIAKRYGFKLVSYKLSVENTQGKSKEWLLFVKANNE